ncbi:MAG: hypothetical protein EAZ43_07160 [Betaproteobacteria bacterium]|nr:MAG: hypothetical protein EAZ43_07160 [Betaproteobacteria bacterium]
MVFHLARLSLMAKRALRRATTRLASTVFALLLTTPFSLAQVPGSLDTIPFPGFASGNGVIPSFAVGTGDDKAYATAIQADGKIVMAGGCATGLTRSMCFVRFNADGTLDDTFDGPNTTAGNGKFTFLVNAFSNEVRALVIQPDQKILALGTCDNKFCLARLNPNGSFDTSFVGPDGTGAGRFRITIGADDDKATAMALQRDGRIVVVGYCNVDVSGTFRARYCIARLNVDGSFDTNFDGPIAASPADGRFSLASIGSSAGGIEFAYAVALQTDDRIVIAGSCPGSTYQDVCMVRLNANGSFDTTFDGPSGSGNGKVLVNLGSESIDKPRAITIQPDGRILVASECGFGNTSFCAVRFNENGSLDTGFGDELVPNAGGSGYVRRSFGSDFHCPTALGLQPDGRIVVAGSCAAKFCVVRLHGDGSLDTAFDGSLISPADGFLKLTFGASANFATSMVLQPDGKIVVAGYCYNGTNDDFCIARLNGGPSSAQNCSLDIDGDGKVLATTDMLIGTRVALGMTGSAVIGGISFPANAARDQWGTNSSRDIRKYLVTQCGLSLQ